jgi:hypothetical protein
MVRAQLMNELVMKKDHAKNTNWIFWGALVLCTLYQSYRYPLQINSTLTSPTYSDTPLILQVGKFIMVLPFFALSIIYCLRKALHLRQWIVVLAVQFLFLFALFKVLTTGDSKYLEAAFWMPFSLALVWAAEAVSIKAIDRFLLFLLIYALGTNLIEVLLFIFVGRLPALAYENSFSVRFGSFLDDPNGFAALLFLLMGWSYGRFKGKTRNFVLTSLVVSLLISQSWTAVIFFVGMLFIWGMMNFSKRPFRMLLIASVCICLTLYLVHSIPDSAITVMETMLESKQRSADGHVFPWAEFAPRWAEWIFHGSSEYNPYEFWWASALVNFGAPWVFVDFVLVAVSTLALKAALAKANVEARPVYLGFLLFGYYFLLGSFNLPLSQVFPINVFFFVFSFLVIFGKIQPRNSAPKPAQGY